MFKKTLLALAIAGVALNASAKLTIDANGAYSTAPATSQLISAEGSQNTTSVALGAVDVTISGTVTGYASAKTVRVTITGGTLTPSTTLTAVHTSGDLVASGTVTYPTLNQAVLTLSNAGETAVQGSVAGNVITLGGLSVAPTSIAAGSTIGYKVEVLSSVGGSVIDSVTGTIATYTSQFSAKAVKTDGIIDVGNERYTFDITGAATSKVAETFGITIKSKQVDINSVTSAKPAKSVLTGSFGFLAGTDGKVAATDLSSTGTTVINAALTTVTDTAATAITVGTDSTATFTATVDGKTQTLAPQTFTVSTEFDYTDAGSKSQTFTATAAAGGWTLNGSSSYVPFLPFSSGFARSVTVTNKGKVAGAITVDWISAGVKATTTLTTMAVGQSVTEIASELNALAAANGITGDAALTIVVNSPDADISVNALYYSLADKDRGIVTVK